MVIIKRLVNILNWRHKMKKADKKVKEYLERAKDIFHKFESPNVNILSEKNLKTEVLENKTRDRNIIEIAKMIQKEAHFKNS